MARQIINLGTSPDDATGDTLRAGGAKINENFEELYASVGSAGPAGPGANGLVKWLVEDSSAVESIAPTEDDVGYVVRVADTVTYYRLHSADPIVWEFFGGAQPFVDASTLYNTAPRSVLPPPLEDELGGVMRNVGEPGQFVVGIDEYGALIFGTPGVEPDCICGEVEGAGYVFDDPYFEIVDGVVDVSVFFAPSSVVVTIDASLPACANIEWEYEHEFTTADPGVWYSGWFPFKPITPDGSQLTISMADLSGIGGTITGRVRPTISCSDGVTSLGWLTFVMAV